MPDQKIEQTCSKISLSTLVPKTFMGSILKVFIPIIEWIIGVNKLRHIYGDLKLTGLAKQDFSEKLIKGLGVSIEGEIDIVAKLPKTGPCIVVCNHPYGMIEGVIIARLLTSIRPDTKVMANVGLQVFKEIGDYFIFANPLKPESAINSIAIKQCFTHIKKNGLLVIFPAGRVSFFQKDKKRITDGEWNRLAIQLANKTSAPILPVFISGTNSALFHGLGRIYYRFRLLMLVREMFKLKQHKIKLSSNNLLTTTSLNQFKSIERMNDFVRLSCYLNDDKYFQPWPASEKRIEPKALGEKIDNTLIISELLTLPENQHLLTFKTFTVYYGYQEQIPHCVREITRLREVTFRPLNEGSGEAFDTDKFDATYLHLFIFDHQNKEIIGAYRIGQTDLLLKEGDVSALYLSQIFTFESNFINQQQPCLEMGRSFIVANHQKSFHGLLLLWKGIGAFVKQHPRYRTLYGTVSLSKLYDPRSVALINEVMVTSSDNVTAKSAFKGALHPQAKEFINSKPLALEQLSALVSGIEDDGKGVPVLLSQYYKLGATFHSMGIDTNFNQTPGLLLSVNLSKAPDKLLKLYLGAGKDEYLNYQF